MIIQKVIKGIGGINRTQAEEILQQGILCNWLRGVTTAFPWKEVPLRLTERDLHWHQNEYDTPDPQRNNQPFHQETPFISTTAGTVERDIVIATNTLNAARDIALEFATDTWNRDGWLFYCYVFILGKKAVQQRAFAEELRELNIYTGYSPWQPEGEITAKIVIPPVQIEKAEFFDLAQYNIQLQNNQIPKPTDTIPNDQIFVSPTDYHNIRELVEEYF